MNKITFTSIKPSTRIMRAELNAHQAAYLANGGTITYLPGPTYSPKPASLQYALEKPKQKRDRTRTGTQVKTPEGMLSKAMCCKRAAEVWPDLKRSKFASMWMRNTGPERVQTIVHCGRDYHFTTLELLEQWLDRQPEVIEMRRAKHG